MAIARLKPLTPDTHHGVPVLDLHVDDPVPVPRAPERYAVRVYPDLARYLLTFNHERNRTERTRKSAQYAGDMTAGLWRFTPESVVFSTSAVLQNGQNRLHAVAQCGEAVWMMLDFGWPDDIITVMDRGAAKTNSDALKIDGNTESTTTAGAINLVFKYDQVVGTSRSFSSLPVPSAGRALELYEADRAGWATAVLAGYRIYRALDHGMGTATWVAAYHIINAVRPDDVAGFFAELAEGTGAPRSATRALADFWRRRPVTNTRSGDAREPLESVIRAFNAYRAGRTFAAVTRSGFELSRVR